MRSREVRGGRAKVVLAFAALLLLALSAPTASAYTRPRPGAIVASPPLLRWTRVPGATRYNIQLYRQVARGTRKILSRWPTRHRFQLHYRWHFRGRVRRLTPDRYFWYVWPRFGSRYGHLRVRRGFVFGRPPVNTSPPIVTGPAAEGATLTAAPGTWTGLPRPRFTYFWQRCAADGAGCAGISGATLATYEVGSTDIDGVVRVVVVGSNIARAVRAASPATGVILPAAPRNFSLPQILGHPHVGATLTAVVGSWLSSRPVAYSYRWLRCDLTGKSCVRVPGATGQAYRLRGVDAGRRLAVVVRAVNSGGAEEARAPLSHVVGLVVLGTPGAEVLRGTLGSDVIRAGAGDDIVYGGRGADRIYGGRGADRAYGGLGPDIAIVRDGVRDWVDCGRGVDAVRADRLDRVSSNCERVRRG